MLFKRIQFPIVLLGALLLLFGTACVRAQADDEDSLVPGRPRKEAPPRGIQDTLSKMRIEKDKKDFNEMLKRGDDVLKLAEQLKESGDAQQEQISNIGKLVKKVREELGAEGSIELKDESSPSSRPAAIKALKDAAAGLSEELKKCTRFTVSASAINRANEVLRLVKYLHG